MPRKTHVANPLSSYLVCYYVVFIYKRKKEIKKEWLAQVHFMFKKTSDHSNRAHFSSFNFAFLFFKSQMSDSADTDQKITPWSDKNFFTRMTTEYFNAGTCKFQQILTNFSHVFNSLHFAHQYERLIIEK